MRCLDKWRAGHFPCVRRTQLTLGVPRFRRRHLHWPYMWLILHVPRRPRRESGGCRKGVRAQQQRLFHHAQPRGHRRRGGGAVGHAAREHAHRRGARPDRNLPQSDQLQVHQASGWHGERVAGLPLARRARVRRLLHLLSPPHLPPWARLHTAHRCEGHARAVERPRVLDVEGARRLCQERQHALHFWDRVCA